MIAQQKPADLVQRLVRKANPNRTIVIVASLPAPAARYLPETELGFGWADALQEIWAGAYEMPITVLDLDVDAPRVEDMTESAARQLAQRTFVERDTPQHLRPLFDQFELQVFAEGRGRSRDPNDEHRLGAASLGVAR